MKNIVYLIPRLDKTIDYSIAIFSCKSYNFYLKTLGIPEKSLSFTKEASLLSLTHLNSEKLLS